MPACSLIFWLPVCCCPSEVLPAWPRFLWSGNVSIRAFVNIMVLKKDCQSIIGCWCILCRPLLLKRSYHGPCAMHERVTPRQSAHAASVPAIAHCHVIGNLSNCLGRIYHPCIFEVNLQRRMRTAFQRPARLAPEEGGRAKNIFATVAFLAVGPWHPRKRPRAPSMYGRVRASVGIGCAARRDH